MSLFIKEFSNACEFVGGVTYVKKGLNNKINPISINPAEGNSQETDFDFQQLLLVFYSYLKLAIQLEKDNVDKEFLEKYFKDKYEQPKYKNSYNVYKSILNLIPEFY